MHPDLRVPALLRCLAPDRDEVLGHSQIGLTVNTDAQFLPKIERAAEAAKPLLG